VDGALLSAGDGHAAQGDGEVCGTTVECPLERVRLTLDLHDGPDLRMPVARTGDGWIALGLDPDLDVAAELALQTMLELLQREHGLERQHAFALASVAVYLRVTQVVNETKGVHAVLCATPRCSRRRSVASGNRSDGRDDLAGRPSRLRTPRRAWHTFCGSVKYRS
jgi:acetamidase/formamidase